MRTFIATVAILCVVQLPGNHAEVRIFEKSFVQEDNYDDVFYMNDDRLTRVACDDQIPMHCKMEQLKIPYEDARYYCEFNLKDLRKKSTKGGFTTIAPFGEDKLIILQFTDFERVVSILHLPECRMSKEARLPRQENNSAEEHIMGGFVVTYEDTFEVFFHDTNTCGDKECRVTIDTEGNLIAGPVPIISYKNGDYLIFDILPLADQSQEKRYVYYMRNNGRDYLSFLHPNGTETVFLEGVDIKYVNTNNGQIGACFSLSYGKNVTCAQYNSLGYVKVQRDFSEPDQLVVPFYLYNLPEGGFLTLVIAGIEGMVTDISVRKVNAAGEQIGKRMLERLDETEDILEKYLPEMHSSRTHIWKDEGSEQYCVALIGKYVSGGYGLTVNCFDDVDE